MKLPGKALSNTQTKQSPNPNQSGQSAGRGDRLDPPKGAQLPGKGLANSKARNAPKCEA
jgi:hypothetical protein